MSANEMVRYIMSILLMREQGFNMSLTYQLANVEAALIWRSLGDIEILFNF